MSQLFLGFDAGTQSVKVAVYDASFKCLTSHSKPTTLHYPNPGWVQMDPDEYVSYCGTHSDHIVIPEPGRTQFFEALRKTVAENGGKVVFEDTHVLYLARKPLAK